MLLDTNVIIWLLMEPERLGAKTRRLLEQTEKLSISVATQYEIALKERLGKLEASRTSRSV